MRTAGLQSLGWEAAAHLRSDSHPGEPKSTTGVLMLVGPGVGATPGTPLPPMLQVTALQAGDSHLGVTSPRFSAKTVRKGSQSDSEHSLI